LYAGKIFVDDGLRSNAASPAEPLSVSAVTILVKDWLDHHPLLARACVRGEVSGYRMYPSGHCYFTLKDPESVLKAVMFRGEASKLAFKPQDGMTVLAFGRISVFPRDGQYQLYCSALTPDGAGALHLAFERLKAKLEAEGLFDPYHKKSLPRFPERIALVTSPAGAVVQDMLRILARRWPFAEVLIVPVRVQGIEAPGEIAAALALVNRRKAADVIITGRGGGSAEDLWAFNEEMVARAIFASEIPVVSAVGHEPDVTIADYTADLRAPTPSAAAELVTPDATELRLRIGQYAERLAEGPLRYIQDKRLTLDYMERRLANAAASRVAVKRQRFAALAAKLEALSPLKVLARGYALPVQNGQVVRSVSALAIDDLLDVGMADGTARCRVETLTIHE
jgi:exodeoxyribonuclease VII large subunit